MTVMSSTNRERYPGNGAATSFAFEHRVLDPSHIRAFHADSDGVETELVRDTDFSFAAGAVTFPLGGSAYATLASGEFITILREVPPTQEVDFQAEGKFDAEVFETALDRLTMQGQQLTEQLGRSIKLPVSSPAADLTLPEPAAGRALAWNDAEDALENGPTIGEIAGAGAAAAAAVAAQSAAEAAQGAAETARDGAVAAAAAVPDVATLLTKAGNLDGIANAATARSNLGVPAAADIPGGLADRLRWLEVNLALNTVRDVIDAGWTTLNMVDGFADEFNDQAGVSAEVIGETDITTTGQTIFGSQHTSLYLATNAFDNSGSTAAYTAIGCVATAAWIGQDFTTARNIGSISYHNNTHGNVAAGGWFSSLIVEWSDNNSTWTQADSFTHPQDTTKRTYSVADAGAHRYWRLRAGSETPNNIGNGDYHGAWGDIEMFERTQSGVSTGQTYDAAGDYYASGASPMVLVSDPWTASTAPVAARAVLLIDPLEAVTLNTDAIVEISRDNGTTWTAGVLTYEADYSAAVQILATDEIDLTGQPSGTQVRLRVRTPTSKAVQVHAWTAQWR